MAFLVDDLFLILAAATAVTGGISAVQGAQSASAQRKAQREQREQQNYRAAQERRQSIRQQRMAYATAQQTAENQGVSGSSGAYGGQGSIITQGNVNLSFLDNNMQFANKAGAFMDDAASHAASAGMWGAASNLFAVGMNFAPVPDWLQPAKPPTAQIPKSNTSARKGPWG